MTSVGKAITCVTEKSTLRNFTNFDTEDIQNTVCRLWFSEILKQISECLFQTQYF